MSASADVQSAPDVPQYRSVANGLPGEAAGAARLLAGRCTACGTLSLPPAAICPQCWTQAPPDSVPISDQGTLYTYTVVRNPPPGFTAPYVIGYVDVPEGLRVMARRDGEPPAELVPDVPVRLVVGEVAREEDGTVVLGPHFELASDGRGGR